MENSKVEIWASIGITKNLGNYESLRLDAGAKVHASSYNDDAAWAELWKSVDEQIESKLRELDGDNGK